MNHEMTPDPLVSIIIPVYNSEKHLAKCLDSIICQTYQNLEIIIVDDGSVDSSLTICNEYQKKDTRIVLLPQSNQGVSVARNVGIATATGEFILFVDSDDWIASDAVEKLVTMSLENHLDCVFMDASVVDETEENEIDAYVNYSKGAIVDGKTVLSDILFDKIGSHLWRFIIKKKHLAPVVFPPDRVFEDYARICFVLEDCDKIGFLGEKLYYYRKNTSGIVNGTDTVKKLYDYFLALQDRFHYALSFSDECSRACFGKLIDDAVIFLSFTTLNEKEAKENERSVSHIRAYVKSLKLKDLMRSQAKTKYKFSALLCKSGLDRLIYPIYRKVRK